MKLIVIGCLLALAYSAKLEPLDGPHYFERTPNNNLVQIKYIGAHPAINNAAFSSQSQGSANFNQELNNQRFQQEYRAQNQRFIQANQQNQRVNQFSQAFNQGNQNFNQQSQVSQFNQQNRGFSVKTEPFSFNNHQFANPNLVEVSFDENRHQQFLQGQERQRQQSQSQTKQRQDFQNQQRQELQNQKRQRQQQYVQRQQQLQQSQINNQKQQRITQVSQSQVQNRNPFFNNRRFQPQTSRVHNFQQRIIPVPERVQSSVVPQGNQFQNQQQSRINRFQNQQQSQILHPGIQNFQNQFPHPIGTPLREIAGHLQRVDSDEILGIFQPFTIPVSASLFEGTVNSQFTCASQGQGFFADPLNNCQQFHVCTRVQGRNTPDLYRFTFQCAEGDYFDQAALTCLRRAGPNSGSSGCAASPTFYQSSKPRALQLFSAFSTTPYTPGQTPPGICYLANQSHFVTGVRRK